ncbi:MAG TPA: pseudouridine synthase [Clostridia bacterium]|nr:pseudouridine synthase [Clostridia bacterium]
MRLQKYIAACGISSRRKAEELILAGRIAVNGETVTELGTKVSDGDEVTFDGRPISPESEKHYILFNKPEGVITTASDEFGRRTVLDFFKDFNERIYPVGILQYDTSGLLILTNDGEFANFMMHPSNHIGKTYLVACDSRPGQAVLQRLASGIDIGDYITQRAKVTEYKGHGKWDVRITIFEGRNRQVRKMFETAGLKVITLKRTGIGSIHDSKLPEGKWRYLTPGELRDLGYGID